MDVGWLKELVASLAEAPAAVAVGGGILLPPCGPVGQCESILGFPGGGAQYIHAVGGVVPADTFSTCNCVLQREAVQAAGGFDERLRYGGEDMARTWR